MTQSIAVSPIQLISTNAAVINGVNYMNPRLVKAMEFDDGNEYIYEENKPVTLRRVISESTSSAMRDILESVVSEGSGKNARIAGYKVGGKTGTAQKYSETGGIKQGAVIASFIGFAPADDPQLLVLFMVDEPKVAVDFGSVVAAPYVKMILEDSLNYMGVEPVFDGNSQEETRMVTVPDVTGKALTDAVKELRDAGLDYLAEQTGTEVAKQMPLEGAEVMVGTTVLLYTGSGDSEPGSEDDQQVEVPDVTNKSIREVNNILVSEGLRLKTEGSGLAVSQKPEAGTLVEPDTLITVTFEAPE